MVRVSVRIRVRVRVRAKIRTTNQLGFTLKYVLGIEIG